MLEPTQREDPSQANPTELQTDEQANVAVLRQAIELMASEFAELLPNKPFAGAVKPPQLKNSP